MEMSAAVTALGALAQERRLAIYRLLVQAGPGGIAASAIADRLEIPPPTLTFHLKELAHAGLARSRRAGRFLYYSADFHVMDDLVRYLTENCCQGVGCGALPERTPARMPITRTPGGKK
jgi:DNA-binding transcriptional ArsR family regulator